MSRKVLVLSAIALSVASSGWVYAFRPAAAAPNLLLQSFERNASRILYWDNQAGPQGEFTVAYSAPTWSEKIAGAYQGIQPGQRARLGKDQWTSLDTNIPLTIGGTLLDAGYYYLAMERSKEGWNLVVFDAAEIHKKNTDPFLTPQLTGGTLIPLTFTVQEEIEDELSIEFLSPDKKQIELEILWGPHKLTAEVVPGLEG